MVTKMPTWKPNQVLVKPSKIEQWLTRNHGVPCYMRGKYQIYGVKYWRIRFPYHTTEQLEQVPIPEFLQGLRKKKLALFTGYHPDGRPKAYIKKTKFARARS